MFLEVGKSKTVVKAACRFKSWQEWKGERAGLLDNNPLWVNNLALRERKLISDVHTLLGHQHLSIMPPWE